MGSAHAKLHLPIPDIQNIQSTRRWSAGYHYCQGPFEGILNYQNIDCCQAASASKRSKAKKRRPFKIAHYIHLFIYIYIIYMWQAHLETARYTESQNSHRKSLKMAVRLPFVTWKQSCVSYQNIIHLCNRFCSSSCRSNHQKSPLFT